MSQENAIAHMDSLGLMGISHHTAPVEVLERLALSSEEILRCYERFQKSGKIRDAFIVSTCNRTEVYVLPSGANDVSTELEAILRDVAGPQRFPEKSYLYNYSGRKGLTHLFRVAAGLDSMVLGEAQILGQVKEAYEVACNVLTPSPYFDRLVRTAFKIGRRIRSETQIGYGAVSIASAAVHLATRIYSNMENLTVAIVGAGETGRLVAEHFKGQGAARLLILNRTLNKAEILARQVDGQAWALDKLSEALMQADIVACAVRGDQPILKISDVQNVLAMRSGRPLAILDLGLPRNVEAHLDKLPNVFLHDLDALRHVVDANLVKRKKEIPVVENIIEEEIDKLFDWQSALEAGPLIATLREAVESIRLAEVERACRDMNEKELEAVNRVTRAVINKLLHGPMTSIKEYAQESTGAEKIAIISNVFKNLKNNKDS